MFAKVWIFVLLAIALCSVNGSLIRNDQGNFTAQQLTLISNIIGAGEDAHGADDLDGLAGQVAEFLNKAFKKCWSVYVFDANTQNGTFSAHIQDQKWLKWFNYGKLNLSYLITYDSSVYNNTKIGASDQATGHSFGKDIPQKQYQYLLDLLTESVVFKGPDMDVNAQYIRSNLYPGNWNVYIASNGLKFGGSECRKAENWARVEQYGRFKWNYYLVRTY